MGIEMGTFFAAIFDDALSILQFIMLCLVGCLARLLKSMCLAIMIMVMAMVIQ